MKNHLPIIHIIGLPGVGKTTLGVKLAKELRLPLYRIGEYRSKFPKSAIGETDAWLTLFRDLSRRKWGNCVLETTGLNRRESFLKAALPMSTIITIKLVSQRKVLYERLKKKKKMEQGGGWFFNRDYPDKREFVKKLFRHFKEVPADITIDTSKLEPRQVYERVMKKLKKAISAGCF